MVHPPALRPGDHVAILSPSGGLSEVFPGPHDMGLRRLRQHLGLQPVEYCTTRKLTTSPQARAADIMAAFSDPGVAAIICSIGGDDQLRVLPHLDPDVMAANAKPLLGFSDCTNLLLLLFNQGVVSYHGGTVMAQLGRGGAMHPLTLASIRQALFHRGPWVLPQPQETGTVDRDWADPATLATEPPMRPASPWQFEGPRAVRSGPAWGGSLEVVDMHLRTARHLLPDEAYDGAVLLLETSEELPDATYVHRLLMCMGERGLLQRFVAVLVGRAKTWSFDRPNPPDAAATYAGQQRDAVRRAMAAYHPDAVVVFDVDFGHTDPQLVIPIGGTVEVDAVAEQITVTY
jgi:muramoyltetrapeptide carboxypeptidase LdcA involved in peptidoglycan recycling